MRECKDCRWFSWGVPDELRKKWQHSNFGKHCDGVCSLYFPRGYIGRKPPHAAMSIGHCFQWEEKDQIEFDFSEEEDDEQMD